ncbi:unnamed protein product, partial [Aureobasidium uvarum]
MSPSSNITTAQHNESPKIKEEWKRDAWRRNTVVLLNGNFSEGVAPPTEPLVVQANGSVLELFYIWLYTGKLGIALLPDESNNNIWYTTITKLYILADELNCIALQRSIVSTQILVSKNISLPRFEIVGTLSDSSLKSSGLYQYYVEALARHWNGSLTGGPAFQWCAKMDDPMPPNLAYHLLMKKLKKPDNRVAGKHCVCCHDPCEFHGQSSDQEREATCGAPDEEVEIEDCDCDSLPDSDTDTEPESESVSGSRSKSEAILLDDSATKKRNHDDGETITSKAKR